MTTVVPTRRRVLKQLFTLQPCHEVGRANGSDMTPSPSLASQCIVSLLTGTNRSPGDPEDGTSRTYGSTHLHIYAVAVAVAAAVAVAQAQIVLTASRAETASVKAQAESTQGSAEA